MLLEVNRWYSDVVEVNDRIIGLEHDLKGREAELQNEKKTVVRLEEQIKDDAAVAGKLRSLECLTEIISQKLDDPGLGNGELVQAIGAENRAL